MSEFIVSARKYRPATFASVVGQQSITSTLKNAIERGQLAHAYLFCGPRGVGKTTCARIFAKAINCMNPIGAEACNECESCRAFNEGRSMNIHELDAASNNSVEDIRALIEQVRILPQVGKYSLFIIDEVHMLSSQAFNAFLKTLEEPPKHAIFILATTEKHKIIPTILSRCQVYDFNRIRVEDSVAYLKHIASQEGVRYDEESLNLIAQKADGGMRDALSMFDKAVSFCNGELQYKAVAQTLNVLDYDTYFTFTDMLLAGDYTSAIIRFDEVLSKGFSGQTFMAGLNQHLRDLLLAKGPAITLIELTGTLLERYRRQAELCSTEFLFGAISILTEADAKIKQSSNQRLLVELGLMKISSLGQKKNELFTIKSDYPLPELPSGNIATPSAPTTTSREPQATASSSACAPIAPNINTESAAPKPATPTPAEHTRPTKASVEPKVAEQKSVSASTPDNGTTLGHISSARHSSLATLSIAHLMDTASLEAEKPQTEKDKEALPSEYDERSEEKIKANLQAVMDAILNERPRFVVAFEKMRVTGHTISVEVPSQTLYEEIMRSKTEVLLTIMRTAGINGRIDLEVIVNEEIKATRPIKLEDRIKHISEKNPLVLELKQLLDMEYE